YEIFFYGVAPKKRSVHSAVVRDDCMYIFGGFTDNGMSDELFEFNLEHHTWKKISTCPEYFAYHTMCAFEDSLYIYGHRYLKEVFEYNFITKVWKMCTSFGDTPSTRILHTAVIRNDSMYVFGGSDLNDQNVFFELKFLKSRRSTLLHILHSNNFVDVTLHLLA